MYNNYEVLYITEYKSYLTISVCLHSFVKRAYTRKLAPCRVGLVVSVSASHTVVGSRPPGRTKDHHKNGTNCLCAYNKHACVRVRV